MRRTFFIIFFLVTLIFILGNVILSIHLYPDAISSPYGCLKNVSKIEILNEIKNCLESYEVLTRQMYPADCIMKLNLDLKDPPFQKNYEAWDKRLIKAVPLKVLFLYKLKSTMFYSVIDESFFQVYQELKSHPDIELVRMWGENWNGWDKSLGEDGRDGVALNIKKHFPDIEFDVIIALPDREQNLPLKQSKVAKINSIIIHELSCKDEFGRCIGKRLLPHSNVVFFTYANPMVQVLHYLSERPDDKYARYTDYLYYHQPHFATQYLFHEEPQSLRNISILLVSMVNEIQSPLNERIKNLILQGMIPGTIINNLSYNYYIGSSSDDEHIIFREMLQIIKKYADIYKKSKIIITTTTKRQFALKIYTEAALSGALLVGNIPSERQNEFRQYMIEINDNESDESIIKKNPLVVITRRRTTPQSQYRTKNRNDKIHRKKLCQRHGFRMASLFKWHPRCRLAPPIRNQRHFILTNLPNRYKYIHRIPKISLDTKTNFKIGYPSDPV